MRTKTSKAAKIRKALEAGQSPKEIARSVKVPIQSVYTEKWKMTKNKPAIKAKVAARRKKIILKAANKEFTKLHNKIIFEHKATDPALDFLRDELASVERQIDSLNTVASFLTIRLRQMEQNNA